MSGFPQVIKFSITNSSQVLLYFQGSNFHSSPKRGFQVVLIKGKFFSIFASIFFLQFGLGQTWNLEIIISQLNVKAQAGDTLFHLIHSFFQK